MVQGKACGWGLTQESPKPEQRLNAIDQSYGGLEGSIQPFILVYLF